MLDTENRLTAVVLPYVAGERAASPGAATFELVNPADESTVAVVAESDEAQVDAAVAAARAAQKGWAKLSSEQRATLLWRWADLVKADADGLARSDTLTMGRPIRDSTAEARGLSERIRYWATVSDKLEGRQLPIVPGHLSYTVREPLGVVAIIIPWNGPMSMFIGRVAAALACGNGVVVKPSELTPLSALRLAELVVEAGIPPGLVNVVTGAGKTGALLAAHPKVDGLNFTGSVPTGRIVAGLAVGNFKKVVLELGGKAPNILFADANLDAAVRGSVWGVFANSGQACVATTRLLVERPVIDEVVERLLTLTSRIRVGDPLDPSVHLGPLASRGQYERVRGYIDSAADDGAELLTGGAPNGGRGFYVQPTIFSVAGMDARIARDEIFGPVLTVLPFDGEEEAVALANDVEFGLSANVWTRDVGRTLRLAERIDAGTIWCNSARVLHQGLPFGGFKSSGVGNASGEGAIDGNTRLKRVSILHDDAQSGPGWDL
jgi:acyl-CoA reductase-like NAD-dependent aldehyde dehydrogenase